MSWLTFVVIATIGIYPTLCLVLGAARLVDERRQRSRRPPDELARRAAPQATGVAVLIAAHNEELVIDKTVASARSQVPWSNIYVVSDGSTDMTVQRARAAGANTYELSPNRGKGGAIDAGLRYFGLLDKYEVVLLLDADTVLTPDYLETGLPLFSDPRVAVVAGTARTIWRPREMSPFGQLLLAYRERIYCWGQTFVKYGQAWARANIVLVVPGFASMYRTTALRHIDITAPGLVVEDLNMTFEVHRRQLGRIAYHPRAAVAYTQDPDTLADYLRQVKRWALALWQTVRRHGFRYGGYFGPSLVVCVVELIPYCLMLVLGPALIIGHLIELLGYDLGAAGGVPGWLLDRYTPIILLVVIVLPELFIATVVAVIRRRPRYLVYAFGFPLLRILDAALVLYTLPLAWTARSTGAWTSPTRRDISTTATRAEEAA